MTQKYFFILFILFCVTLGASDLGTPSGDEFVALSEASENLDDLFDGDYASTFKRMVVSLVTLIALVAISFYLIKRIMNKRYRGAPETAGIKILEKKALSPKSMLYLVEIDQEKVLISESHLEVRPLQTLKRQTFKLHTEKHSEKV